MRKIYKIGVAIASGILTTMGFGGCRSHLFLPLEYGTPNIEVEELEVQSAQGEGEQSSQQVQEQKQEEQKQEKE